MTIPTWVVGQVLSASDVNNWLTPFAIRKPTDEPLTSNTTLQADNDLVIALPANSAWDITAEVLYEGGTTGSSDMKWEWTGPSGSNIAGGYVHNYFSGSSLIPSVNDLAGSNVYVSATGGASNRLPIKIGMSVTIGSTPGNLTFLWAQNTSSGTPVKVRAGSKLLAQRTG